MFFLVIQGWYSLTYIDVLVFFFQEEGPKEDEEESDKSVSEVNDEDDADDGSDEVTSLFFQVIASSFMNYNSV